MFTSFFSYIAPQIGLISDEKLLDLLDFALSADTINTVKNLRDITASGVEPLALMSQLATVITDILAGSYDSVKQRPKRKFFQRQACESLDFVRGCLILILISHLVMIFFLVVCVTDSVQGRHGETAASTEDVV